MAVNENGRGTTEVVAKTKRRRFSAKNKLRILKEAEACAKPGELGALLRRQSLYSSHLTAWRKQREQGQLEGLTPRKRGPKGQEKNPLEKELKRLERENAKLQRRAERAEALVEVQKKVSELLGVVLPTPDSDDEPGSSS